MDGTKLMGQQYDGVAKTIIDFSAITATTPVGSMTQYGGDTAPSGWLMCDGNSLLKASYADLFSVIAYKYGGSGDNFNLPDLRGRIPVHRKSTDTAFDTLGETGGSTDAGIPAHSHTATLDSSNWDGYLQAHETWLWPIKDLDAPQHNSTGSLDTTMGLSAYGAGTDCVVRDGEVNGGWHEVYTAEWGSSDGTCGNQATDGDQFGVAAYMTGYPNTYHHHSDATKNYTMKVDGTVTVGESGSGDGGGSNMPPYIVTNTIIRYA